VREFGKHAPKDADELAGVKFQVAQLQQQLAETQRQNQYFAAKVPSFTFNWMKPVRSFRTRSSRA
jgi:hypothetical protein